MKILPKYIVSRFFYLFLFCLICVVSIVLVVDLVENFDRFIDNDVPWNVTILYYLYYIPYVIFIALPVATLMATTFSIGNLARRNELVAMKSLGYSLYRLMFILLLAGFCISIFSFSLSEVLVVNANRKKNEIQRSYLAKRKKTSKSRFRNLVIQEPPNIIIFIGSFNLESETAFQVKIETIDQDQLVSKIDAPMMRWDGIQWIVESGFERFFFEENEKAESITEQRIFQFQFTPKDLLMAQEKPDAMNIRELRWFINRVRKAGGEVQKWLTQYNFRYSFPFSTTVIILFSLPIAYNRRKKSLAIGFGVALMVCFFYFGIIQMGQTLGEKGELTPWVAAWLGNMIMSAAGSVILIKTRK